MENQHQIIGPIPTNLVRAEVCRRKGKKMVHKTWQTWAQDFRHFFPEVTLNSENQWTSSKWEESESSDNDGNSDDGEELDQMFDDMFGQTESQSSAPEDLPGTWWDGEDDEKQREIDSN